MVRIGDIPEWVIQIAGGIIGFCIGVVLAVAIGFGFFMAVVIGLAIAVITGINSARVIQRFTATTS